MFMYSLLNLLRFSQNSNTTFKLFNTHFEGVIHVCIQSLLNTNSIHSHYLDTNNVHLQYYRILIFLIVLLSKSVWIWLYIHKTFKYLTKLMIVHFRVHPCGTPCKYSRTARRYIGGACVICWLLLRMERCVCCWRRSDVYSFGRCRFQGI